MIAKRYDKFPDGDFGTGIASEWGVNRPQCLIVGGSLIVEVVMERQSWGGGLSLLATAMSSGTDMAGEGDVKVGMSAKLLL